MGCDGTKDQYVAARRHPISEFLHTLSAGATALTVCVGNLCCRLSWIHTNSSRCSQRPIWPRAILSPGFFPILPRGRRLSCLRCPADEGVARCEEDAELPQIHPGGALMQVSGSGRVAAWMAVGVVLAWTAVTWAAEPLWKESPGASPPADIAR